MGRGPIRVLFCGCDGLFSALVLRRLLVCDGVEVVGVVRSTRLLRPGYGFLRGAWHQVRQSGIIYALYLWMVTSGVEVLSRCSLRRLVRSHGIPILATRNLNDSIGLAFVARAQPDVLISAFFNQRIGDEVLGLPGMGGLNIHPSLLPEFRGVDPVFFARLRGAPEMGVTVHRLERRLDMGRILVQQPLEIPAADSVFRTTARLFAVGGHLLAAALVNPLSRQAGYPQPESGSYDSWPSADQVRLLLRRGGALVRLRDLSWVWALDEEGGA